MQQRQSRQYQDKARYARWKIVTPKTLFATDKRLLIRDPNSLGLRSDVDAIPYTQINNVKLENGVFTSKVIISSGYFNNDQQGFIDAIPKEKAAKIVAIVNEGIRRSQTHTTEVIHQNQPMMIH